MSKKKGSQARSLKGGKGGGGGGEEEPLRVNWFVLGGALLVVGVIVFFSIRQSQAGSATPAPAGAAGLASGGDCTPSTQQWSSPPEMAIDTSKDYTATFKLQKGGEFVIQLLPDKAPITVNSFVFLARQGYYNCVTFHRVLSDNPPMAQGGDPTGTGGGGPGYQFQNEDSDLTFDKAGVVAMANAGRDTNGSQFFITFAPVDYLNGGYTIFGQVIEGMDVVNGLTRRDPDQAPDFQGDVIESITITES